MGYAGSVILMVLSLAFIMLNENMGWGLGSLPVRTSFVVVGLWWAGFAQINFKRLPPSKASEARQSITFFTNGFYELKSLDPAYKLPYAQKILRSFFFTIWACKR